MISRRTTLLIADAYSLVFTIHEFTRNSHEFKPDRKGFYRFLYERDYEAWFCNLAEKCSTLESRAEFITKLHTGESIVAATKEWKWEARCKLGQALLIKLAQDYLVFWLEIDSVEHKYNSSSPKIVLCRRLLASLELDGYSFKESRL